ncbi:hypothetical protein BG618_05334 [Pseudonocardia autotrophica]|nr:hypothetical protein BG618_05334 [Pseudonocardia autotrophica]
MIVPPCQVAVAHIARNSSSVPKAGSSSLEMRSKWPSTLGVGCQPESPPAFFTGPVWTPSMPIVSNACHSSSLPSAARNDSPEAVISEIG